MMVYDCRRERKGEGVFVECPARRCSSAQSLHPSHSSVQCNAVNSLQSHSLCVVVSRWKGSIKCVLLEIYWSLRMFCRWNCTVEYNALMLWEREGDKKCFGSRGIRNAKGPNCEIGPNILHCLPQNHALHEYMQMQPCCQFDHSWKIIQRGMQRWFLNICLDLSKNLEKHVTIFVTYMYIIILTTKSFQNIPQFDNFVSEITERQDFTHELLPYANLRRLPNQSQLNNFCRLFQGFSVLILKFHLQEL